MRSLCIVLLLSLSLVIAATSDAETNLRCSGGLVKAGDTMPEVMKECGEPIFVNRPGSVVISIGGVFWSIDVEEEWIYNLGPSRFIRFVRFRGGRVVDIGHGNYGWTE
jgi:Protein of unknown function (DUF2845)